MHRLRGAATAAVVALLGAGLGVGPAAATAPTTSAVLVLRPTSESALHALTQAHGISVSERARRLHALVPDAARHRTIELTARALGLSVDDASDWSVRVHGPTATVASLFGTLAPRRTEVAGRAFPLMPPALDRYVVAALPTSGRVARPLATSSPRDGTDFRTTYSAPPDSTGAGLAVATVQLSGWNSADLKVYAQKHGITGFNLEKQYVARAVDNGSTDTPDHMGGDEEVALDQEAILASAPGATQVAYFASNDDGGESYVDAIRNAGTEAPTYHTVSLSLSWGGCEASDDRKWLAAMDSALAFTLAAGVTIFAASGDAGSEDCLGEIPGIAQFAPAVDYPASSPSVVAVGGVSFPKPGTTGPVVGWSGSGGGESSFEPLPSWQNGVASRSRTNHRLVPDISSDADPDNGFLIYDSHYNDPNGGHEEILAGTSLGSPIQAALLADTLSAAGWSAGVGDIHPGLYDGASAGATKDVTADELRDGNGTYHSGAGYDLVTGLGTPVWTTLQDWFGQLDIRGPRGTRSTTFSISPRAPTGYAPGYQSWSEPVLRSVGTADCSSTQATAPTSVSLPSDAADGVYGYTVAGLANSGASGGSAACRVAGGTVVLDRHAPTVAMSVTVAGSGLATARWSYADAAPSSGLWKFVVVATAAGKTQWTWTTTNRTRTFSVSRHNRWHLKVTAYDTAGNTASATAHVYDDTTAFSYGTRWKRVSAPSAFRRGFTGSGAVGATAKVHATAKTFVLFFTHCATCGKAGVYDGRGHHLMTVDLYSSRTRYRVPVKVLVLSRPSKKTLVIKVLSARNRHAKGHEVGIDALTFF